MRMFESEGESRQHYLVDLIVLTVVLRDLDYVGESVRLTYSRNLALVRYSENGNTKCQS